MPHWASTKASLIEAIETFACGTEQRSKLPPPRHLTVKAWTQPDAGAKP
jgi:hypothetical protein